jgi:hypothetical protein
MDGEFGAADSHRLMSLAEKFHDKRYRDGYVAAHTRGVLARQMRNFRGDLSQADYATKIGKQKTVIGRLENPAYGGWSLRTMREIAQKENVAVLVRFVDFPTFLGFTDDMSEESLHPRAYDQSEVDFFAEYQSGQISHHDLRPLDLSGGTVMGASHYSDLFFGPTIGPSRLNNFTPGVNVTTGSVATSGVSVGLTVGVPIPGLFDQSVSWAGVLGFATIGGFPTPPTPGVIAHAQAEIRRLAGIVEAQKQQIQKLQAQVAAPQTDAQGQGQGIVQFIQGAVAAQAANQNKPAWQLRAGM